jgi:hypothetical protein
MVNYVNGMTGECKHGTGKERKKTVLSANREQMGKNMDANAK